MQMVIIFSYVAVLGYMVAAERFRFRRSVTWFLYGGTKLH